MHEMRDASSVTTGCRTRCRRHSVLPNAMPQAPEGLLASTGQQCRLEHAGAEPPVLAADPQELSGLADILVWPMALSRPLRILFTGHPI